MSTPIASIPGCCSNGVAPTHILHPLITLVAMVTNSNGCWSVVGSNLFSLSRRRRTNERERGGRQKGDAESQRVQSTDSQTSSDPPLLLSGFILKWALRDTQSYLSRKFSSSSAAQTCTLKKWNSRTQTVWKDVWSDSWGWGRNPPWAC